MSRTLARAISRFAALVTATLNPRRRAIAKAIAAEYLVQEWPVTLDGISLRFAAPTGPAAAAAQALERGEPETRAWLREFVQAGETLWDIGANVGIFSLYAALTRRANVVAFEAHAQTFAALMRNIQLNGAEDRVRAFCVALDEKREIGTFFVRSDRAGDAMSSYGRAENVAGAFAPSFRQPVLAFSADEFAREFALKRPDHIKLDVDGNEDRVLRGAAEILKTVKSVCVELLPAAPDQARNIVAPLESAGLQRRDSAGAEHNVIFAR